MEENQRCRIAHFRSMRCLLSLSGRQPVVKKLNLSFRRKPLALVGRMCRYVDVVLLFNAILQLQPGDAVPGQPMTLPAS